MSKDHKHVNVALTVQAAAYAAGDVIGGKVTIADALQRKFGTAKILSVVLCTKGASDQQLDVVFCRADPSGTTFTENGAVALHANDYDKPFGFAEITDWCDVGAGAVGQAHNLNIPVEITGTGVDFYAFVVARGTGITPASTADITLKVALDLGR